MPAEPKLTSVTFNLWMVLTFLVILGAICIGFLNDRQNTALEKQQAITERVVTLEAQYCYIIKGLDTLTLTVKENNDKLDNYRMEIKSKKTNMSDLQWK
jgi:hypothetical protein